MANLLSEVSINHDDLFREMAEGNLPPGMASRARAGLDAAVGRISSLIAQGHRSTFLCWSLQDVFGAAEQHLRDNCSRFVGELAP